MAPSPLILEDHHVPEGMAAFYDCNDDDDEADELKEALEIMASSSLPNPSPRSSLLLTTTREGTDGKAWVVSTETEQMLQHPHLQLSLITSSCQSTKSPSSSSLDTRESPKSTLPLSIEHTSCIGPAISDDEESVGYFESDDFKSSYWIKAVTNVPTLSLAAILTTGFAIMHPWIFVVGALTAVGTAHAVGVGYEWMTGTSPPPQSDSSLPIKVDADGEGKSSRPPTELFCRSFSYDNLMNNTTTTATPVIPPKEWLPKYFPALEFTVISNQEFPGLSASEFFQVFFADDAPYSFMEFQKKRGDADICYGAWREVIVSSPQPLSIAAQAALLEDDDKSSVQSIRQRVLTFKTLTKSYFGPPFAIATKKQSTVRHSKRCVVIESVTTLSQIPFCDRFHIVERWVIQSEKKGTPSRHVANLQVYAQVIFTAKCPFEQQIRTKSAATIIEVCKAWCNMAQEALKLTEQAKLERLQRQEEHEDVSCGTSVSSDANDEDPFFSSSSSSSHEERDQYESSIEVPYAKVYVEDSDKTGYPVDVSSTTTSKRFSFGSSSPRFFRRGWKRNQRVESSRVSATSLAQ